MLLRCQAHAKQKTTDKPPQDSHLANPSRNSTPGVRRESGVAADTPFPSCLSLFQTRMLAKSVVTVAERTQVQSTFGQAMKKAVLLYNPDSGGGRASREPELESVVAMLRAENIQAELVLTHSPADAAEQARRAPESGFDAVFACGGDGTIHSIVQGMINSPVALAVLPMGTANALAHDLGLPMSLSGAARALLKGVPRRVALGRIEFLDSQGTPGSRYFVVAAGAGVDAHLFYKLHTGTKKRLGMAAYYAKAWHMWFSYPMTRFRVDFAETGSGERRQVDVTELMAVRIRNFGGVLRELAPGASLNRNDLRLVSCRTASRWSYLLYVTRGLLGRKWKVAGIDLAHSDQVCCSYLAGSNSAGQPPQMQPKIYVEADGELVGTLPAKITVVPDALTLLAPS
jgi:YegS/Rv2252/BmrU family lipid kinase